MIPTRRTQQTWLPDFFNDLFDDNFGFGRVNTVNAPAINVIENEKEYKVEMAAPGMTKEDLTIKINEDNQLVITMAKKEEKNEEKKAEKYLRREFSYSHFEQAFMLPDDIKKEEIGAAMENGVLKISLPKLKEVPSTQKERLISIK